MKFEEMDNIGNPIKGETQEQLVDPTKVSLLSQAVHLEKDGADIYDLQTGEKYFEKEDGGNFEYFVTLLSKGILHTSDIVREHDQYYSREMPLQNVEKANKQEQEAEVFILRFLFGDSDHLTLGGERIEGIPKVHNARRDDSGKFVHYDYGQAFTRVYGRENFVFRHLGNFLTKREVRDFSKDLAENDGGDIHHDFVHEVKVKLNLFKNALQDENFYNAVLKKSGMNLMDGRFRFLSGKTEQERIPEMRKYLLERIDLIKDAL